MVEALAAARKGGGLYRGTAALLAREVPFYALGMVTFEQLKRVAQGELTAQLCLPSISLVDISLPLILQSMPGQSHVQHLVFQCKWQ